MLELKNITKSYVVGSGKVEALKGVSIKFRKNEFVAILGQSGCGKTTMLNIIGGLDRYTNGDLIVNGKSTKDFKDRDWDSYRNHSIGFVFQSYNLIPHQTVLQNVELALSLSGVSKVERKKRAIEALEMVGLSDQIKKKPSEMSGGQMQRVAIARAIVNNPDIILADEPTGALDTETSLQVMEILKKISEERLVIMVTHNPELAERYATRTIKMLDGLLIGDSNPLTEDEVVKLKEAEKQSAKKGKIKLPSMSYATSFGLSLKNLFTKKGRTILTAIAGSIGIIGIALIYAVSQGMTTWINIVQEETLSSYPLTIEATNMDMTNLFESFLNKTEGNTEHNTDEVYQKSLIYNLINSLNSIEVTKNDLKAFKTFLEAERAKENGKYKLDIAISGIKYTYLLDMSLYTKAPDGTIIKSDTDEVMREVLAQGFGSSITDIFNSTPTTMPGMSSSLTEYTKLWQEMVPGDNGNPISDMVKNQYDLIHGSWPNSYNEILLIVDENNEIDDLTLYALGLISKDEVDEIIKAAIDGEELKKETPHWKYEDICKNEYRVILNSDCYKQNEMTGLFYDIRNTEAGLSMLYDNATTLKVTGIIRPKEDALAPMLTGSIAYTHLLTEYAIEKSEESAAVKAQKENPSIDILNGLPFRESGENLSLAEKEAEVRKYISSLDTKGKANVYKQIVSIAPEEKVQEAVIQALSMVTREQMETQMITAYSQQMQTDTEAIKSYFAAMKDEDIKNLYSKLVAENYKMIYKQQALKAIETMPEASLTAALEAGLQNYTPEQFGIYYDTVLIFSESSYDEILAKLGSVDIESPNSINIYASSFADKDAIEAAIAAYNSQVGEFEKISYTDYVGLMMTSITTIIDAITYILISFVAVSLIVSSIMIGVITLISVQERTKEIGILRAIGASKRNVSNMFNAETVIIGFISGLLGVGITYLLCIPINIIIHFLTGIGNLNAFLPIPIAIILVAISVFLNLISGIIPSRSAAKKDPVVALRTE